MALVVSLLSTYLFIYLLLLFYYYYYYDRRKSIHLTFILTISLLYAMTLFRLQASAPDACRATHGTLRQAAVWLVNRAQSATTLTTGIYRSQARMAGHRGEGEEKQPVMERNCVRKREQRERRLAGHGRFFWHIDNACSTLAFL